MSKDKESVDLWPALTEARADRDRFEERLHETETELSELHAALEKAAARPEKTAAPCSLCSRPPSSVTCPMCGVGEPGTAETQPVIRSVVTAGWSASRGVYFTSGGGGSGVSPAGRDGGGCGVSFPVRPSALPFAHGGGSSFVTPLPEGFEMFGVPYTKAKSDS